MFEENGIVVLNKPSGMSSNTACNKVKRLLGVKKAGHLGTLDLLGDGLLLVTINRATKLFESFLKENKTYRSVFRFGSETNTLDLAGEVINSNHVIVKKEDLEKALVFFVGKQNQIPPNFSRKCVSGKRAYQLALSGEKFELKPKEIEIFSFRLIREIETNIFELEIECSSGTYIRSLCRDVAAKFSTYGTMLSITRTKCGVYSLENAVTLDEIKDGKTGFIPISVF